MVATLNIERQEFNEITMAREYSYLIGDLLRDKLGKLLVQSKMYYLTASDNTTYTLNLSVFTIEDDTQEDITVSYTSGTSESIETILNGLSQAVVDNSSDKLVLNAHTDYTSDEDKHFFIIPKQGYRSQEVSIVNITTATTPEWTESDVPASYVGYGKQPTSSLPRIIITPIFQDTVCDRMEESVMLVDGVETEYTSSYMNYSLNITCEAGSTEEVMRTSISSQSILNTFRKMMVNEIIKNRVQNEMKSVCYPMTRILNAPAVAQTQYMDASSAVMDFSCVDVYFPETGSGFIETVEITSSKFNYGDETLITVPPYNISRPI